MTSPIHRAALFLALVALVLAGCDDHDEAPLDDISDAGLMEDSGSVDTNGDTSTTTPDPDTGSFDGGEHDGNGADAGDPDGQESFCAPLPLPTEGVVHVTPDDDLARAISEARSGQTLLLAPGVYDAPAQGFWVRADGVTVRGASHRREDVVVDGGYRQTSGGIFNISGQRDVTIAHLSIRRSRYHAIHATGGQGGPSNGLRLHDLHVSDPGEQAIKINANHGHEVDDGVLSCSLLELTDPGREQVMSYESSGSRCYTGGVDAHRAQGWVIRDNTIRGFWCSVSALSQHGIHFWRGARDTLVERNLLIDNARGIGFGLGNPGPGRTYDDTPCQGVATAEHYGGIIRNNVVVGARPELFDSPYGMDLGIGLESACDAIVVHNTVASVAPPFVSIEWRFEATQAEIVNNLATHTIRPRNDGQATLEGNLANASLDLLVDFHGGNLAPASTAAAIRAQGNPRGTVLAPTDFYGETRQQQPDIGAIEFRP